MGPLSGPDGTTLALLCWNLVKYPGGPKIPILWQIFRTFGLPSPVRKPYMTYSVLFFIPLPGEC